MVPEARSFAAAPSGDSTEHEIFILLSKIARAVQAEAQIQAEAMKMMLPSAVLGSS